MFLNKTQSLCREGATRSNKITVIDVIFGEIKKMIALPDCPIPADTYHGSFDINESHFTALVPQGTAEITIELLSGPTEQDLEQLTKMQIIGTVAPFRRANRRHRG